MFFVHVPCMGFTVVGSKDYDPICLSFCLTISLNEAAVFMLFFSFSVCVSFTRLGGSHCKDIEILNHRRREWKAGDLVTWWDKMKTLRATMASFLFSRTLWVFFPCVEWLSKIPETKQRNLNLEQMVEENWTLNQSLCFLWNQRSGRSVSKLPACLGDHGPWQTRTDCMVARKKKK